MKTNQVITRKMGDDYNVLQRTKDGMFNATDLIRQWNVSKLEKKELKEFFKNKNTKEFIKLLIHEHEILENKKKNGVDNQVVKIGGISRDADYQELPKWIIDTTRGKNGGTWMNPDLYFKFAMWISPEFELSMIRFIQDHLIEYRNKLGDQWAEFTSSCQKIGCTTPEDYKLLARCLNCAVFGKERQHEQRNVLSEEEAKELFTLVSVFVSAVKHHLIRNISDAKKFFQEEYTERFLSNLPFAETVVIN